MYNEKANVTEFGIEFFSTDMTITWNQIEILCGRKLEYLYKPGRKRCIICSRKQGHIKLYDAQFVINQKYRYNSIKYTCKYITKDKKSAFMVPIDKSFNCIFASNIEEWEIIDDNSIIN